MSEHITNGELWWDEATQTYRYPPGYKKPKPLARRPWRNSGSPLALNYAEPAPIPQTQPVRVCHYCGGRASTKDHIVPVSLIVFGVRYNNRGPGANIVPACQRCNSHKGALRSDCQCEKCTTAWTLFGPENAQDIPVVLLVKPARDIEEN